jgi:AraC-like DNA-binding protein
VIEQGACWLRVQGDELIALQSGDLVVLSQGAAHDIASDATLPAMVTIHLGEGYENESRCAAYGEGPDTMALICGTFDLDEQHPLLSLMPAVLLVRATEQRSTHWLDPTLRFFAAEAKGVEPGTQTMLRRLADMLFIQVVRFWLRETTHAERGWLAALRDPQLAQALGLLHKNVQHDWKVSELAEAVGMSRSAFSARFSELVGEAPMAYLTRWRMQRAARLLLEKRLQLTEVAARVGYESDAAFSKAFKRALGVSPGVYRRNGKMP